jgi:hypothetical protein
MARMGQRLTYANVVSTLCFFLLLAGGAAYAAGHLAKNSVGSKQLKKNAVTTAKVKKEAITAAKVKKGTLTGTQINVSTLGTVPTAQTANSIAAPEAFHEVGKPGEPGFLNGWTNVESTLAAPATVGFYKDREGVVHLRGEAIAGKPSSIIFQLPPGYRPSGNVEIVEPVTCVGCPNSLGNIGIGGPNPKFPADDGFVLGPEKGVGVYLDGVTFRAES